MGYSEFDPATQGRAAWNAGKAVGTKRPLTQKQIWAIRFFLDREGRLRDRALFDLAIDSKLRGCDLVKIMMPTFTTILTRSAILSIALPTPHSARPPWPSDNPFSAKRASQRPSSANHRFVRISLTAPLQVFH